MTICTIGLEGLNATVEPLSAYDHEWAKGVPYTFGPLTLVLEYLEGETRTKVSQSGFKMESVMPAAYGELLGTTDIHGEKIDVYLSPLANQQALVYVIDQVSPQNNVFDEHKVMLGFGNAEDAILTYCQAFSDGSGPSRLAAITAMPMEVFVSWCSTEGATLRQACVFKKPGVVAQVMTAISSPLPPPRPKQRDEAGGVQIDLPDLSQGPKLKTVSNEADHFDHHMYLYSTIDVKTWSNAFDTVCRLLDLATEKDTLHIHIASGGGSVFLMGRLVSAITRTKAKVITYAEGTVASAAVSTWMAGHERYILPGAYFMQHMSSQLLAGKTGVIADKAQFCRDYIKVMLQDLITAGLFTEVEVSDMDTKSSDIYITGREAIARVGAHSVNLSRASAQR